MASPRVRATRKKMDYDADDEYQAIMYKIAEEAIGKDEGCKCLSCLEHYCPVCRKEGRIGPIDGDWLMSKVPRSRGRDGGPYVIDEMKIDTHCKKCEGFVAIDIKPEDWRWCKEKKDQVNAPIYGCDECKWTLDETNKAYKAKFYVNRECAECGNETYTAWADRDSGIVNRHRTGAYAGWLHASQEWMRDEWYKTVRESSRNKRDN